MSEVGLYITASDDNVFFSRDLETQHSVYRIRNDKEIFTRP